jgi:ribose transport system ATP-binding protein
LDPLVELVEVSKSFGGIAALKGASLRIDHGQIHALIGENGAGKSTLMRVLGGEIQADSATLRLQGRKTVLRSPHEALEAGIAVIHQELALAPDLSVAENVFLGTLPKVIGWWRLRLAAAELIARLGFTIDPAARTGDLTVAHQQVVEIAKALSRKARVLVLDEPTAVLSPTDSDRLLDLARRLKSEGVSIVYISHRLEEVLAVADQITVMRDGRNVTSVPPSQTDMAGLVDLMVGRSLSGLFETRNRAVGEEALRVTGLRRGDVVRDVSFGLRKGEILGLGGLVGSGRTETARLIFGADRAEAGTIHIRGALESIRSPRDAVRLGIGLVPEDRKEHGAVLEASIRTNVTLAASKALSRYGFILARKEKTHVAALGKTLRLKAASIENPVSSLSGGNQQKIVLAKWFHVDGDILILDEPTRGVDIGAKAEIYAIIQSMAEAGKAVLLISSDHEELMRLSDRIIVMGEGAVRGELLPKDYSQNNIIALSIGAKSSVADA